MPLLGWILGSAAGPGRSLHLCLFRVTFHLPLGGWHAGTDWKAFRLRLPHARNPSLMPHPATAPPASVMPAAVGRFFPVLLPDISCLACHPAWQFLAVNHALLCAYCIHCSFRFIWFLFGFPVLCWVLASGLGSVHQLFAHSWKIQAGPTITTPLEAWFALHWDYPSETSLGWSPTTRSLLPRNTAVLSFP